MTTHLKLKLQKIQTEVSTSVIGVSIALMCAGGSGFVTAKQGKKIEKLCRESIKNDFGHSPKNSFNKWKTRWVYWSKFNAPAGILIMHILGENIHIAMMPDGNLSMLTHQMVMDQLMLMMLEPNKIWKL